MKIKNVLFTTFLFSFSAILIGCGGGGSSGGGADSARPTPWPINPVTVRSRTGGLPPNVLAGEVVPALNRVADAANTLLYSREQYIGPSTEQKFLSYSCRGTMCSAFTADFSITIDISDPDSSSIDVEVQPVATQSSIPLAQGRARERVSGRDLFYDGNTLDFYFYGGWLDNSGFQIQIERVVAGSLTGLRTSKGISFGNSLGTNPTGSGSATWNGVMVGRDVSGTGSQGNIVQGDAAIVIDDLASPDVDIEFTNIVDLNAETSRNDMTWENIALTDGEFETGSAGDSIEGRFYGSGHEEVGGVFERDSILGAFGAER